MYATNELKKGLMVEIDGVPHVIEATQTSSPTARGGNTSHRIKFRNLKTGQRLEKTYRSGDMLQPANVDQRPVTYLYADTDTFHFMDGETYEQFGFSREEIEWEAKFLREGLEGLRAMFHDGIAIALALPNTVDLAITDTAPAVKGNSATARTKAATLETGHVVQVPEHIDQDTRLVIDTRTGEFVSRAK